MFHEREPRLPPPSYSAKIGPPAAAREPGSSSLRYRHPSSAGIQDAGGAGNLSEMSDKQATSWPVPVYRGATGSLKFEPGGGESPLAPDCRVKQGQESIAALGWQLLTGRLGERQRWEPLERFRHMPSLRG
jgi:hypothetical protein